MYLKASKELQVTILLSRIQASFANTIATFRGRPSKQAMVVLYETFQKEFSDDAAKYKNEMGDVTLLYIEDQNISIENAIHTGLLAVSCHIARLKYTKLGSIRIKQKLTVLENLFLKKPQNPCIKLWP